MNEFSGEKYRRVRRQDIVKCLRDWDDILLVSISFCSEKFEYTTYLTTKDCTQCLCVVLYVACSI